MPALASVLSRLSATVFKAAAPRKALTDRPYRGDIDHERIGRYMRALSVPTRLLLLQKLQVPQTSSEIRLPAFRRDEGLVQDRVVSRQTVEEHLERLVEVGLVERRRLVRSKREVDGFVVNPARLYAFVDELRRLSLLRPSPGAGDDATRGVATSTGRETWADASVADGPALVLVSGPHEGRAFPLTGAGPWILGRTDEADVTVPYDPFVSSRNSEIARGEGGHWLRSLPHARNGTTLNWRLLARDTPSPIRAGDTIGLGRTLLVFRGE